MTTTPAHILTVTAPTSEHDYPTFEVECPGLTPTCETWGDCEVCPDTGTYESIDDGDPTVHGVEHRWFSWGWSVPSGLCFVAGHDHLADEAGELRLEPGRYAIGWTVDDETDLILRDPIKLEEVR